MTQNSSYEYVTGPGALDKVRELIRSVTSEFNGVYSSLDYTSSMWGDPSPHRVIEKFFSGAAAEMGIGGVMRFVEAASLSGFRPHVIWGRDTAFAEWSAKFSADERLDGFALGPIAGKNNLQKAHFALFNTVNYKCRPTDFFSLRVMGRDVPEKDQAAANHALVFAQALLNRMVEKASYDPRFALAEADKQTGGRPAYLKDVAVPRAHAIWSARAANWKARVSSVFSARAGRSSQVTQG
jgi:hypothetical protein